MTAEPKLLEKDYPNLYQASDYASKSAQSNYILIVAFDLISMILASALAIYNYQSVNSKTSIYVISGVLLLLGFVLTIIIITKKFEDIWYQGRALAESCKTLTWRFITCSELFENSMTIQDAKTKFIERTKEFSQEFVELNKVLNAKKLNLPVITDPMLKIRQLSLVDRKAYYIRNRIEDQKTWYSDKAEFNKKKYNFWFGIILTSQALSIVSISFLISNPKSDWNLVGLFTTIASSAISWLQLKQHQELKQAYTTASQELNFIVALADQVQTENEFSTFVLDSENAISREHTLWLAQKRK